MEKNDVTKWLFKVILTSISDIIYREKSLGGLFTYFVTF